MLLFGDGPLAFLPSDPRSNVTFQQWQFAVNMPRPHTHPHTRTLMHDHLQKQVISQLNQYLASFIFVKQTVRQELLFLCFVQDEAAVTEAAAQSVNY